MDHRHLRTIVQGRLRSIRSIRIVFDMFDRFDRFDIQKIQNFEMPFLKELSRSSQDSFELESDSKESRDVWLNSPKSGIWIFSRFFEYGIDRTDRLIDPIDRSIRSIDRSLQTIDRSVDDRHQQLAPSHRAMLRAAPMLWLAP